MKTAMAQNSKLNSAAIDGLLLALVTIIFSLIGSVGIKSSALSVILWILKLVITIWLLLRFMKKYSARHAAETGETTYNQAFGYGFLVSVLSAVVIGCYMYLSSAVLFPEQMTASIEAAKAQIETMSTDSAQTDAINSILNNIPIVLLFTQLIWCTICGLVISAILASSAKTINLNSGNGGFDNNSGNNSGNDSGNDSSNGFISTDDSKNAGSQESGQNNS